MPAIVVDAGGTNLRCAVANDDGELSATWQGRIPNFLSTGNPDDLWHTIVGMVASYVHDVDRTIEAGSEIVFAVPGPVIHRSRLIGAPTVLGPSRNGIPDIASLLSARTGRRVRLINDVTAAAWRLNEVLLEDRFFVVTVSSGIGSKLFDRKHPERVFDAEPYCGEIGHLVVDCGDTAPLCDCGGRGHLGAISSGRGTERLARRTALANEAAYRESLLYRRFGVEPKALTNEQHLVPAVCFGDEWARRIVALAAEPLARVLSAIVIACAVDRVVLIGGFAQALGSMYEDIVASHVSHFLHDSPFSFPGGECVRVLDSSAEVCLAGAAAFYSQNAAQS